MKHMPINSPLQRPRAKASAFRPALSFGDHTMKRIFRRVKSIGCIAALLGAASALAAPPATTVAWVTPTGSAQAGDPVDVWLRLAVNASATTSLVLDGSASQFDLPADLPGWAEVQHIDTLPWVGCQGSFIPGNCYDAGSAYRWAFNLGSDSFVNEVNGHSAPLNITLAPGQSHDFLLGSFIPQNGPIAAGHYTLGDAGLEFFLTGIDANGNPIQEYWGLGDACHGSSVCEFSRDITAVPEPTSALLLLAGLGAMVAGGTRRFRGRAAGARPGPAPLTP